jgi:V-type H+-transporting ATPase subunit D
MLSALMFPRLKKVQGKKKRDTAAREAEAGLTAPPEFEDFGEGSGDLLSSKDADVIF